MNPCEVVDTYHLKVVYALNLCAVAPKYLALLMLVPQALRFFIISL